MTGAALLFMALTVGCALIPADTPSDTLIGEWVVEDVDRTGVIDNANLTVAFDETGRIYGSAGCNRFTGAYTYDGAFGALKVTPLGVTRRMCAEALMNQEGKLVQSLQGATRAETQADGAVALTSDTGRVLLRRRSTGAQTAAAKIASPAPVTAPVYDPSADPLAPASSTTPVSPTALPPSSTSTYALSGAPGAAAPLYTPIPPAAGAPLSKAPAAVATPAPAATPYAAAALTTPSPHITATGEITFLEVIALPPDAVVRVQLRDVSRLGAPATVLGQQEFPATAGPPFPFTVTAPSSVIAPTARLTLFAQILSGNRLLFITDTNNPVPLEGTSAPMRIRVVNAAPHPSTSAQRPQIQAPRPATASTAPAPPSLADIPGSIPYRCLTETFRIAFEDRVAYLTTADGAVARLARIDASDDPGAPRMFSNSILTVLKDTEAGGATRVRFARGRMALTTCTKA